MDGIPPGRVAFSNTASRPSPPNAIPAKLQPSLLLNSIVKNRMPSLGRSWGAYVEVSDKVADFNVHSHTSLDIAGGSGVGVNVGVDVGTGVIVEVGVNVGPNTPPAPQPETAKLKIRQQIIETFLFTIFSFPNLGLHNRYFETGLDSRLHLLLRMTYIERINKTVSTLPPDSPPRRG